MQALGFFGVQVHGALAVVHVTGCMNPWALGFFGIQVNGAFAVVHAPDTSVSGIRLSYECRSTE